MKISIFIFLTVMTLLTMIFNHIVDDFNQGYFLSTFKQKIMWEKDDIGKDAKYKNDYKIVLLAHSFKWSFIIHIPIFIFCGILFITNSTYYNFDFYCGWLSFLFIYSIISNTIIHYNIDDLKANKYLINLILDQIFHLIQIVLTLCTFVNIFYTFLR